MPDIIAILIESGSHLLCLGQLLYAGDGFYSHKVRARCTVSTQLILKGRVFRRGDLAIANALDETRRPAQNQGERRPRHKSTAIAIASRFLASLKSLRSGITS